VAQYRQIVLNAFGEVEDNLASLQSPNVRDLNNPG
jgi:outer membrane protein TolC